jgi:nucleotide-binding universal stress UspA family protein
METNSPLATILVPTDFSAGSEQAWKTARRLAQTTGAELILLHVLPATPLDVEAIYREEERFAELRARQAAHQLAIPRTDVPPSYPRVFHGPFFDDAVKEFSEAGRAWATRLEEWADAAQKVGIKVRTVFRVGVPHLEILEAAKDERASLVLLATHGRGEIHRLLVGSVAEKVIRMATCPVMTVREAA